MIKGGFVFYGMAPFETGMDCSNVLQNELLNLL